MLNGNNNDKGKKMKGLISQKTTLHLQHSFLVHFFAIVLHDYNVKRPSLYTFYLGNVICIPVHHICICIPLFNRF